MCGVDHRDALWMMDSCTVPPFYHTPPPAVNMQNRRSTNALIDFDRRAISISGLLLAHSHAPRSSVNQYVAPRSRLFAAWISPPWPVTMRHAMVRPRPALRWVRARSPR